ETQPGDRSIKLRGVYADHIFIHDALRAREIPLKTFLQREVERDGYRRNAVIARYAQQAAAGPCLQVGGVDHRQSSRSEPDAGDVMQQAERRSVDTLIAFVVADHRAASVGGDDFSLFEMARREG